MSHDFLYSFPLFRLFRLLRTLRSLPNPVFIEDEGTHESMDRKQEMVPNDESSGRWPLVPPLLRPGPGELNMSHIRKSAVICAAAYRTRSRIDQ